jgi:Flp pilus assembly protein TadD
MRRCALLAFFLASVIQGVAEDKWIEVRSPNFSVATNAGEKRGREIVLRLEQMRRLFVAFIPREKLNSSAPLQVIAFKSNQELKQVTPLYQGKPVEVDGIYFRGDAKHYIALDAFSEAGWRPVLHEYAHHLLNTNYARTPPWFSEGFAEYYSTVRVDKKNYYIGEQPPEHRHLLVSNSLMPVERLFAIEQHSEEYNKQDTRRQLFYAQSRLVIHYIFDGKRIAQAAEFFDLTTNQNVPIAEAIRRAYGMTPREFDQELQRFASTDRPVAYTMPVPEGMEQTTYVARKMKLHEAQLLVADLYAHTPEHEARAENEYKGIITQEPYFADAHRGLGYIYYRKGDLEAAQKEFRRAADLDSQDPRVYYFIAYFQVQKTDGVNDPELLVEASQNLDKALKFDPTYAEAYDLKGTVLGRARSTGAAIRMIQKALQLEPRNERFQFNLATHYMANRNFDEATALFEKVAKSQDSALARMAQQQIAQIRDFRENPLAQLASESADKYTAPQWRRKPGTVDDNEAEALEQAQTGNTPDPPDPRKVRYAKGVLLESDCRASGRVVLEFRTGKRQIRLMAPDAAKILVIGADQFECGWKNKRASVNYRENSPNEGDLISIEVVTR